MSHPLENADPTFVILALLADVERLLRQCQLHNEEYGHVTPRGVLSDIESRAKFVRTVYYDRTQEQPK